MIPPLLVLIRMLELFICSKALLLNRWCSSGEKAQVTMTKSDTSTKIYHGRFWRVCHQGVQVLKLGMPDLIFDFCKN